MGNMLSTLDGEAVNNHFDVVIPVSVHLHALGQFLQFTVHADMQIAFLPHALKQLAIVTLTALHQRRQYQYLPTLIVVGNHFDDLLLCVFHHRLAGLVAVCLASTCKEQAQIVVHLRRRAYRRTRVFVRCLLLNADDGRQSRNLIHVRALHASEEVTRIGRERLDIAALAFGKDGVEGQTRLSASAQSGDDRQRVTRNFDVYVLEVMYACAPDVDFRVAHGCCSELVVSSLWRLIRFTSRRMLYSLPSAPRAFTSTK